LTAIFAVLMLGLAFTGTPLAQTQTTTSVDLRHFEVIAVDGNRIVVRDERGTNEYTVAADFRFNVDGKQMAASELKAGMKGTATVTTTTKVTPVVVTEIRHGVVLDAAGGSVTVMDDMDKTRKRFTQGQLNDRGLQIFRDGRLIVVSQLNKGDEISATIVSELPPQIVTEQEVNVALARPDAAPAKTEAMATTTESAPAKTEATTTTVAQAAPATTPPATTAAPAPAESSLRFVILALVIVAILFFAMRKRSETSR